jgi:hypothetical protein
MNRVWVFRGGCCLLGLLALAWLAGCASPPPRQSIPADDIRARADRAFDDVSAEESGTDNRRPAAGNANAPPTAAPTPPAPVPESEPVVSGQRPEWIDGESRRYPSVRYLTGVGYGADRPGAEDRARSEIAKVFYSEVTSSNRTLQQIMESAADGQTRSSERIDFEEVINVSTHKVLSGVRVVQVYRDSDGQPPFYALAVLDRYQAKEILTAKIGELDADIRQLYTESLQTGDKLTRVKQLQACVDKHALRQAYDAELRVVDPAGRGMAPSVNFTDIQARLNETLLKDFFIAVSVSGPRADEIRQALTEALNEQGFAVSEQIADASVLARGTVDIQPIDQPDPKWKFVRWKAYFDLVDRNGGAVFGSVQKTGREGHLSTAQAEERAVRKMRGLLAADIAADLKKHILSLSR